MDMYILFVAIFSLAAFLCKKKELGALIFLGFAILHFAGIFLLYNIDLLAIPFSRGVYLPIRGILTIERGIIFLIESIIVVAVALYNINFIYRSDERHYSHKLPLYHAGVIAFVGAMDLAIFSDNIAMVWVFIELSTLLSALLIAHHTSKTSLEATWKYVFICSIGIALALAGIIFLSIATDGDLNFSTMMIEEDKSFAMNIAIVFLIVGFGTKVGLAPMHNWLPDAHSEAVAPISALLSASLLNSALVPIVSLLGILNGELLKFATNILLIMGFMSMLFAGVFILKSTNFKRMLAYSSIENMGIIMILFALAHNSIALIHVAGHSIIKCALFLTAGNLVTIYGSKEIVKVKQLLKTSPINGYLWLIGGLSILGFAPSVLFVTEIYTVIALFQKEPILAIIFALLLTVIIYGFISKVMVMLKDNQSCEEITISHKNEITAFAYLPIIFLIALNFGIAIIAFIILGGIL